MPEIFAAGNRISEQERIRRLGGGSNNKLIVNKTLAKELRDRASPLNFAKPDWRNA